MINSLAKGLRIVWERLTEQGVRATALWAVDHAVRIMKGAPMHRVSQITPHLHVGGQYYRRGWPIMAQRGITAVIDMRVEFDDREAGVAPASYLHLPVVDDEPPSLEQLFDGVQFLNQVEAAGGSAYVHCSAGVGRAPTMAAAYLVTTGMTPAEAWQTIRTKRPFIRPKPAQVAQVERFATQRRESSK